MSTRPIRRKQKQVLHRLRKAIRKQGYFIYYDRVQGTTYTVGMRQLNLPDIIIEGAPENRARYHIRKAVDTLLLGDIPPRTKPVYILWRDKLMDYCYEHYGDIEFQALQLVLGTPGELELWKSVS